MLEKHDTVWILLAALKQNSAQFHGEAYATKKAALAGLADFNRGMHGKLKKWCGSTIRSSKDEEWEDDECFYSIASDEISFDEEEHD